MECHLCVTRGSTWDLPNTSSQSESHCPSLSSFSLSFLAWTFPQSPYHNEQRAGQDWAPATARTRPEPRQGPATEQMALLALRTRCQPMPRALAPPTAGLGFGDENGQGRRYLPLDCGFCSTCCGSHTTCQHGC